MLGLLFGLAVGAGALISGLNEWSKNEDAKRRARDYEDNSFNTYLDARGKQRDLDTGHVMMPWSQNGIVTITDLKTGNVRNITEEKNQKLFNEKKQNHPDNETVLIYTDNSYAHNFFQLGQFTGFRCKDYQSGEIYVEKGVKDLIRKRVSCRYKTDSRVYQLSRNLDFDFNKYHNVEVYVNLYGRAIRFSDFWHNSSIYNPVDEEKIIKRINDITNALKEENPNWRTDQMQWHELWFNDK